MTPATAAPARYRCAQACMGTMVSFDVRDLPLPDAERAVTEAMAWLNQVDEQFSAYRPDSETSQVADGRLARSEVSPLMREVLNLAEALSIRSHGAFTVEPFGRFDPSGMVKGWAVERASRLLAERGSGRHAINAGGDVQALGWADDGVPWRIGIARPDDPQRLVATVEGPAAGEDRFAVATSGTAERGGHIDGRAAELASVTVLGASLTEVDAAATAAFALGAQCQSWLEVQGLSAIGVAADGFWWETPGFDVRRARLTGRGLA